METSRYCGKTIISLVKLKTEALDLGRQFIFGTNDKLFQLRGIFRINRREAPSRCSKNCF